jgi:hypothetical protein
MRRHEESSKHDFDRAVRLGHDNAECLRHMPQWCKHLEIERTGGGMYAEISGLPIAGHKIGCPFVEHACEAMNLHWLFSDFLVDNCYGCPHHAPNGDTSWAQRIIDSHLEAKRRREAEVRARQDRIAALRADLRSRSQEIGATAEPESKRIVEFLESLFGGDDAKRVDSAGLLERSAKLAPELFPPSAVDLILALAASDEFSPLVLPICREFAARRPDLSVRLQQLAIECIDRGLFPENFAEILDRLGNAVKYPLPDSSISRLLLSQRHSRPVGGWLDGEPHYTFSTTVLVKCFDANPESVQAAIRRHLNDADEHVRAELCGAVHLLQETRPLIVLNLSQDLMTSLDLEEHDRFGDGVPSSKIVHLFAAAFRHSATQVDEFLSEAMNRVRPAVQEDLVRVYRDQLFDRSSARRPRGQPQNENDVPASARIAINRLMAWIRDDSLEPDIRSRALEAIEIACSRATPETLDQFDALFGYFAIICEQDKPPSAPPRIVLPGEAENPALDRLNAVKREQDWDHIKQRMSRCLQELCELFPSETADTVCNCFDDATAKLGNAFKGSLVRMLGRLGKNYHIRPRVLPLIMRALMDYSSAWVRAKGIEASIEAFEHSRASPPANLVDTVVIHLSDAKVVVHQAAVKAASRQPGWFKGEATLEALQRLAPHLMVYRDDSFELATICECVLTLGCQNPRLKAVSFRMIDAIFPTGEELADVQIAKELLEFADPPEDIAVPVARKLCLFLARYERDRNSYHLSEREDMFRWLRRLSGAQVDAIATDLLASAKEVAQRDTWECCQFACLFAHFRKYAYERDVLTFACRGMPEQRRFDKFRASLNELAAIAGANAMLESGDRDRAERILAMPRA